MVQIYGDESGEIVRLLKGDDGFGPPDSYASMLEFDAETNSAAIEGLDTDWNSHALIDGTLYRSGELVTINPPGAEWRARERVERAEQDARNIPGWATWTEQEAAQWYADNVEALLTALPDIDTLSSTQHRNNAQQIDAQFQDIITAQAQAIKALARMVIALRNRTWPKLEEGIQ